jgi:hypothetical protein
LYCVFSMFFPHRSAITLSFMSTIFVHKILITEKFSGLLGGLLLYSVALSQWMLLFEMLFLARVTFVIQIYRLRAQSTGKYELKCVLYVCMFCVHASYLTLAISLPLITE